MAGSGNEGKTPGSTEQSPVDTLTWLDADALHFLWDGGKGPIRVTIEGDRSVLDVHAARAFPLSDPDQLVQLFAGGEGEAVGIVEDIGALATTDRAALEECLRRDRILPEVTRIETLEERRHIVHWVIETDRGMTSFDMDKVYENVRRQPAGDVVLTDVVGNRYHVYPEALDAESREMLDRYG